MASPQHKRLKSRRVTEPCCRSTHDIEASNATVKKFLGGKQKDWMTGAQISNSGAMKLKQGLPNGRRATEFVTIKPSPTISSEKVMSRILENAAGFVDLTAEQPIFPEQTGVSQDKSSRITIGVAETVLPSPAPSDDVQTCITESAGSEKSRDDEDIQTEVMHTKQLEGLADSFKGIKQLMEHSEETTVPPNSDTSEHVLQSTSEVGEAVPRKRPFLGDSVSHSVLQVSSGSSLGSSTKRPQIDEGSLTSGTKNSRPPHGLTSTSPSLPSLVGDPVTFNLDFNGFLQILEGRANQVKNSHIEVARLRLLQKACLTHDTGYLILHQLYCFRIHSSKRMVGFPDLTQEHIDGLTVISHLLLRNDQMTDDAVRWFESFPRPLITSLKIVPEVYRAYERVKIGLVLLAREWQQFKALCQQRKIPPLVDELLSVLGIDSPVLQQVIFRAVKREYWVGDQDHCYREGEQLFEQNQRDIRERDPRICTSQPHVVAYNQPFMFNYRQSWFRHLQHAYQSNDVDPPHSTQLSGQVLGVSPSHHAQYGRVVIHGNGLQSRSFGTYANTIRPRPPLTINTDGRRSTDATTPVSTVQSGRKQQTGTANDISPYLQPRRSAPPTPIVPSNSTDLRISQIANTGSSRRAVLQQKPYFHPISSPGKEHYAKPYITAPASVPDSHQKVASTSPFATDHPILCRLLPSGQICGSGQEVTAGSRQNNTLQQRHYNTTQPTVQQRGPGGRSFTDPRPLGQTSLHSAFAPNRPTTNHLSQESPWRSTRCNASSTLSHIASPVPLNLNANQHHAEKTVVTLLSNMENVDNPAKYHYFETFAMKPVLLESSQQHFEQAFHINGDMMRTLTVTTNLEHSPSGSTATCADCLFRLRIAMVTSLDTALTEDQWTVAPSFWPRNIAISLNGVALHVRQKAQQLSFTPFDLTQYVKEGDNKLSMSIIRPLDDPAPGYFAAVEILRVIDDETIKSNIARLTISDALIRLLHHSSTSDPDVQVVDSPLLVELTDPYTSRIFDVPVRSLHCRHHQCFDLDNFLRTRNRTFSEGTSQSQDFKCPICKSDARPGNLIVDEFFVKVGDTLRHAGRLDARAILIDKTGAWRIKDIEENGESGDGSSIGGSQQKEPTTMRNGEGILRKEDTYIDLND